MAEIHPFVQDLIDALLVSNLAGLGRLAEGRVLSDAADGPVTDGQAGKEGARDDKTRDGLRQLQIASEAVEEVLELELVLLERNQQLLKEYRSLSDELRGERTARSRLEAVIVGDALNEAGTAAVFRGEHVLTGARRERLKKLLEAWRFAVEEARGRLDPNGFV